MTSVERPTILCIEDNREAAALITEILGGEGFDVIPAETGLAGLAALNTPPDLVLCDIDLPDLSGLRLLERIREGRLLPPRVPFIFVTAYAQRSYQMEARALGCDDYVTKPIDFELLIAIIRHRLSVAKAAAPQPIDYHLTERELQALTWAARGKSSVDIATILNITERTVNFHIENAMKKLGVGSRIQAAVKGAMLGLIKP